MRTLAFIPATGRSQSIPLKNMHRIDGMPLVGHVLKTALTAKGIYQIVVSTDHKTIKDYVELWQGNSSDDRLSIDIRPNSLPDNIEQVIQEYLLRNVDRFDAVLLLQPTSPFVTCAQIERAINLLMRTFSGNSVQTVCKNPHNFHPLNSRYIHEREGKVSFVLEKQRKDKQRKQDKLPSYRFGNLVITRVSSLLGHRGFFARPSYFIKIDPFTAQDLDTLEDFRMAEALILGGYRKDDD